VCTKRLDESSDTPEVAREQGTGTLLDDLQSSKAKEWQTRAVTADSQGQNTLAEELRVLTSRTTSRMEVHEMEVAPPLRLLSCDKRWQHSSKS
jgi:hypothetical protein